MAESILNSTKKALGLQADYTEFDSDIKMFINSAFSTLHQLGVGPITGFMITDASTTWDEFLYGDNRFNSVQQYVYLKVRQFFDPPTQPGLLAAMQEAMRELEWRLNVVREGVVYGTPVQQGLPSNGGILDGGGPGDSYTPNPSDPVFDGGGP